MRRIRATVKVPENLTENVISNLNSIGIETIQVEIVPYEQFVKESRLNYDCVFPQMWSDGNDVAYLRFFFDDSDEGRRASYKVEYDLMQIPLNLRYEEV